jgi:acyl-CoA synthetase (AMP-forming)/AMP-acid ligase II
MHVGTVAAATPNKAAVIMARAGGATTYAELDAAANRLANLLYESGLRPGDHIAFMLDNRPEFFACAWAAQRSGLHYTPVSTRIMADELGYILDNCGATVFIAAAAFVDIATAAVDGLPRLCLCLALDGDIPGFADYSELVAAQPATPLARELEGEPMLYSSGTTGRPKGIERPITEAPLGSDPQRVRLAALFGMDADTVYLSPAPLYHAAPLGFCMALLRLGATVVVLERFDPEHALQLIQRHRVTHTQMVPTMFIRLLKLPEPVRMRYDLSSLRGVVHAAAPCPVEVKRQIIDWWGPIVHEYYAGTEANGFVTCDSAQWLAHEGTVGHVVVGEVHILDENGDEQPVGDTGTVYFADGPTFEYHDDPAKTASVRDPQGRGWTTLGDIGRLDEDGFLYLTDRRTHMIISGGVNIYPQECENILALHPKVADVAVIGVPDPDMGEQVKAVVQPVSIEDAGDALETELIAYCRDRLAHYKCPRSIDFRAELPRHPTGKLFKRLLREEYLFGAGKGELR